MERRIDSTEEVPAELQSAPSFAAHADRDDARGEAWDEDAPAIAAKASQVIPVVTAEAAAELAFQMPAAAPAVRAAPAPEPSQYELRALTTEAELYESYQLRYEVYGALGYLQCFNRSKVELDVYDRSSIPFGAFDTTTGELIGMLRLITTAPQPDYDHLIENVLTECFDDHDLRAQAKAPRTQQLPAIGTEEIDRQLVVFNRGQFTVHELSRFIVHPGHRYSHVSRGLVQLAMAHAMQSGPAVFIAGCLPRHVRLYASYGFIRLPQTELHHFDSVGQLACTIVCRSDVLPPAMRSQVDGLSHAMASGVPEHTHELSRDSRARFRFAAPAPGQARCTDGSSHGLSVPDRDL